MTTEPNPMPDRTIALIAYGTDDIRVETVAVADPSPDEAIVAIAYGGICGSDLHYWKHGAAGQSVLKAPMRLGHEASGTVVRRAGDGSGPGEGTPVTVHPATPAATGAKYPVDRPNLSPGCRYMGSAAQVPHDDGLFIGHVAVPTRMLRVLPDGLDLRIAALAEPASVAWHAVERAGTVSDKTVLVVGTGPIGALIVAVARRAGAARIVAVDLEDFALDVTRRLGAHRTVDARDGAAVAAVEADVTFECSGNQHGLASAINGTARGGRVVMVGLPAAGPQPVPLSLAITREIDLIGSFRFNTEMDDVIQALADGSLDVAPVITAEYPVADALDAFALAADASRSSKVLLTF
ncbi:L-idonate 5-dehydrogenase (NAD(P)(+)) [Rhodococcus fascians]|uniref:zinc-binding dehydrogenase n=1 Tax=Rhodococcoides fascians TaxID=1828 RepID=UPI001427CC2F|nr:L-idonate 5-dehydrogenase (NAD(P)(+)) [Rhodococcus fascians]